MAPHKKWTADDLDYLSDHWGTTSIPSICKRIHRSTTAVLIKAQKLGLGPHLDAGRDVSYNQLILALGYTYMHSWLKSKWLKQGFPLKRHRVNKCYFNTVNLEAFWKWAEKHKSALDFKNFQAGSLGVEPSWVKQKREADQIRSLYNTNPWTPEEDQSLVIMLNQYRFTQRELSQKLNRTEGAIIRRICDLQLKQRPIREEKRWWTEEDTERLIELHGKGYQREYIGKQLGRSAKAIEGKLQQLAHPDYLTNYRRERRAREREATHEAT